MLWTELRAALKNSVDSFKEIYRTRQLIDALYYEHDLGGAIVTLKTADPKYGYLEIVLAFEFRGGEPPSIQLTQQTDGKSADPKWIGFDLSGNDRVVFKYSSKEYENADALAQQLLERHMFGAR